MASASGCRGVSVQKRLQTLTRIVEVKEHQRRSAEWRLARLRRQKQTVLEDQESVIAALNADQPLHGLFVENMARHLRVLDERLEALRRAEERLVAELERQTIQLKQAERMQTEAARQESRAREWKELSEVIEAALARDAASLP
jgi:hypothetical protein